jgi:hypothetical protein
MTDQLGVYRLARVSSVGLGVMSLAFGLLKLISPFRDWYGMQIEAAGLPSGSYALGILGEIVIGLAFLAPLILPAAKRTLWIVGSLGMIVTMAAAIHVHLHPAVPAAVLPLTIKPPIIPATVLIVAALTLFDLRRRSVTAAEQETI